ncbi:MAG TPA: NAD-dependent epimerase/dehydratase family protein, partial [Methylomirabilota bacterium]|nr:NAD-dependent epimerase/dehydratase family protein [Methylomirabilota bacterium]
MLTIERTTAPAVRHCSATSRPGSSRLARTPRSTDRQPGRVAVTGGAGFVGHAVVRRLRERGNHVVALVRDPGRAPHLAELGVELVPDDLSDVGATTEHLKGADGLIHAAGSYRIGIARSEHGRMWDANVGTTTRVLDAA